MNTLKALSESGSSRGEPAAKRARKDGAGMGSGAGSVDSVVEKYKRNSKELVTSLLDNLKIVWAQIQEQNNQAGSSGSTLSAVNEVEVRLGMLVMQERRFTPQLVLSEARALQLGEGARAGLEFRAGVDESNFHSIKQALVKRGYVATDQAPSRLRVNTRGQRWEIGKNNNTITTETKRKFFQVDLALLSHEYDVRISAARETPGAAGSIDAAVEDSWTQERLKRRTSYVSKTCPWRVDVTDVEITSRVAVGSRGPVVGDGYTLTTTRELEIEIELDSTRTLQWAGAKPDVLLKETTGLAQQLSAVLNICLNNCVEVCSDQPLEQMNLSDYKNAIRDINQNLRSALNQQDSSKNMDFIGSMPVNLTRKNLNVVLRKNYFVTEKTDGIRYLLYVVADPVTKGPVAVLMDRKGAVFKIPGSAAVGEALGVGTVLDGELVHNRTYKKQVFLMFDVLAIKASPKLHLTFSERIDLIAGEVNTLCRKYLEAPKEAAVGGAAESPLWLIRKIFRKKTEIGEIVNFLRTEDGERVYFENERRHHKSDGIIFQADAPYIIGTNMELFKWKWLELRSVDLQAVTKDNGELRLFAAGPEATEIDCMLANTVSLAQYDTYRLRADMEEASLRRPIVEVTYDTVVGTWRYHHLRRDKKEPNKIQTVIGVMLELAEQIPIEELEYSFLSGGSGSDFSGQVTKMKEQLLEWKRKSAAKR